MIHSIILFIHIACGSMALIAGPLAMVNQNGNRLHRQSGKTFFYSMTIVFISAVYLSITGNNMFLFLIAFFSYYNIVTGYRALYLKQLGRGQKPRKLDISITCLTALFHIGLIAWGAEVFLVENASFGIVALVFGVLGAAGNLRDYRHYRKGYSEKNGWLFVHISGMTGGYIAALTAFLVNTVSLQPSYILWLGPTVIFVPVIIYTSSKFRKKFKKGSEVNDLATLKI